MTQQLDEPCPFVKLPFQIEFLFESRHCPRIAVYEQPDDILARPDVNKRSFPPPYFN
jgi:hypothetical protein